MKGVWVAVTYVMYIFVCYLFFAGIPAYAVFVLGHSPWYLLIGLMCVGCYSPWRWHGVVDGVERPFNRFSRDA